jgi:ATP-binding cassette, subfamily C, bacterial LapB
MIYDSIEIAKNDYIWLMKECQIEPFSKLKQLYYRMINIEDINSYTDKTIYKMYEKSFKVADLDIFYSRELDLKKLPTIAFIENIGIRVVIDYIDGNGYKTIGVSGIEFYSSFPKNTNFLSFVSINKGAKKFKTAKEMFINIALKQKRFILFAIIATLSINFLALGTSFYSMQVYDRVVSTGGISTLIALTVGVFIAIFLETILKIAKSSILDFASKKMDKEYSHSIFNRFLDIRCDALPKSIGTLSAQIQSYGFVRSYIATFTLYILVDLPFSFIFLAAIMLLGGFELAMIVVVFFLISIIIGILFKKNIKNLSKSSSMASNQKLGVLVESIENAEKIKVSGAKWSVLNKWNSINDDAIKDEMRIKFLGEMVVYISTFFQQVCYIALVAFGAYLITQDENITMGSLIAITILSSRVLSPIAMLPNILTQWGRAFISIEDLNGLFLKELDNNNIDNPLYPHISRTNLLCNKIKFGYTNENVTLSIDNLEIKQGEKVAILGVVGSGKSTLLKILAGIYSPKEGRITLDNIDITKISRDLLSEQIGYLSQSPTLISGTLRDNLSYGIVQIKDEDITETAKKTLIINLINSLPSGLDTVVPEGGESVSGGQKQLIAITRLLLQNPKIWLLDEPTANVDDGTERFLLNTLKNNISEDQTLVVVTHKPSVLELVDRIIVLTPNGIAMDGDKQKVIQSLLGRNE